MATAVKLKMVPTPPSDDIHDVPDRFVACRSLKHAWEIVTNTNADIGKLTPLVTECLRCTTQRIFGVDKNGTVRYRRYAYPEGYLKKKGGPKFENFEFRLRLLELDLSSISLGRRGR